MNTRAHRASQLPYRPRPPRSRWKRPVAWAGAAAGGLVAIALIIATDIYPIIGIDSLFYLEHSNSIGEAGFVQLGSRQVGYPAFLASVDWIATALRFEPLLVTVMLQRIVYLSALGFGVWLWRWRAVPLVLLGLIPSLAAYTNLILTEGLAIGLALWSAVVTAWVLRLFPTTIYESETGRWDSHLIVAGTTVGAIFALLATIRVQYVLMVFGLIAVLAVMHRVGRKVRTAAYVIAVSVVLLVSSVFVMMARENAEEYGVFFPSVRAERSQFWGAWWVTFLLSPENQSNDDLADLYADGDPYIVIDRIDNLPDYHQQTLEYDTAMDRLIAGADTSWWRERTAAFFGVLRGGRIDDIGFHIYERSRADPQNIEESIYGSIRSRSGGVESFVNDYNDGRPIESVLVSSHAPLRTFPYFGPFYSLLLIASLSVLVAGTLFDSARSLASVGIATVLVTAAVFGYFLLDNVRFILVPLMFVLAVSSGVADSIWRRFLIDRPRRA